MLVFVRRDRELPVHRRSRVKNDYVEYETDIREGEIISGGKLWIHV